MSAERVTTARQGQGAWSRLGIWTQVVLTSLLALVAVLMVNWLAGRPGIRIRTDLTKAKQNTLSTAASGVIEKLPGLVTIDVFFRLEDEPITGVALMAQERTRRLLGNFRDWSSGNIELRENDTTDLEAIEQRQRELKLRGFENCLVVSYDGQREIVRLLGDLAVFDAGAPPPNARPPRIIEFNAERAIVAALLGVTRGETQAVYFSTGQGEREVFDELPPGLGELQSLLADEGLVVGRWSPVEDGPIPDDATCLSIIGASEAFSDQALDEIEVWIRAGGRLVVAPAADDEAVERSRVGELLERLQIEVQDGIVCQPVIDPQTGRPAFGDMRVSSFLIRPDNMSRHPLLDPIRTGGRSFAISGSHPLRITGQPRGGVNAPLFTSDVQSWVDAFQRTPSGALMPDFRPQEGIEPAGQKFLLGVATSFRPEDADTPLGTEAYDEARVVTIGSSYAFSNDAFRFNYDFLRNVYNWTLAREFRLSISPRDPDLRVIPPELAETALPRVNRFAWGYLPGICLLLGLVTALMRGRGGPRSRRAS